MAEISNEILTWIIESNYARISGKILAGCYAEEIPRCIPAGNFILIPRAISKQICTSTNF